MGQKEMTVKKTAKRVHILASASISGLSPTPTTSSSMSQGVGDYHVALAAYRAAVERWPGTPITLRQGTRVIKDSRRLRLAWSDQGRQGGR
jgi:hypothetical protein